MSYRGDAPPIKPEIDQVPRRNLFDEVRARMRLKHYSLRTEPFI